MGGVEAAVLVRPAFEFIIRRPIVGFIQSA
jgi:hypothetical protein